MDINWLLDLIYLVMVCGYAYVVFLFYGSRDGELRLIMIAKNISLAFLFFIDSINDLSGIFHIPEFPNKPLRIIAIMPLGITLVWLIVFLWHVKHRRDVKEAKIVL